MTIGQGTFSVGGYCLYSGKYPTVKEPASNWPDTDAHLVDHSVLLGMLTQVFKNIKPPSPLEPSEAPSENRSLK